MFLYKRYLEKENSNKATHIVQKNTVRKDGEGSRHYLSHQVGARQEIQFGHVVVWSVWTHFFVGMSVKSKLAQVNGYLSQFSSST